MSNKVLGLLTIVLSLVLLASLFLGASPAFLLAMVLFNTMASVASGMRLVRL